MELDSSESLVFADHLFPAEKMQDLILSSLVALLTFAVPLALGAPTDNVPVKRDGVVLCNGQAAFCDRIYSNISFIGSHDSAFVGDLPTQNQLESVTDQLNGGIRFLQAQTHSFLGTITLCHTSCFEEDSGSLQNYLSTVKTWLDNNPNDLVTMLLTNGDNLAMSKFASVFQAAGIDKYAFTPSSNPLSMGQWPTLGQMIGAGQRLVVFIGEWGKRLI